MTLITSPPYTFLPAYRPIKYLVMVTAVKLTQLPLNAVVQIFRDGSVTAFATERFKSSYNEQSTDPSEQDYYFEIDIQKFCQETLAPFAKRPSTFPPKGNNLILFNDIQGKYEIRIEYEYIDLVTGLLRDDLWSVDLPAGILVIPATLQHTETMNLQAYKGTPGLGDGLFLTHSARNLELTRSDDAFLVGYGAEGFILVTYDSSGAITSTSEYLMDNDTSRHISTINTSIESLQIYSPFVGTPDFGASLASYKIAFTDPAFPSLLITEYFTYTLIKECGSRKKLRLHYMNYLGGTDSYTFDGAKDFFIKTESSVTEKALDWVIGSLDPHLISDVGKSKFRSKAGKFYKLKSKILTITEAEWLEELLSSPKVYADIGGELVPVVLGDGEFRTFGDKGKIQLEINVFLANDLIIQR